jgi:hypothetical protein
VGTTKAHCGNNVEEHGIAGGQGIAGDPATAQIIAWILFMDAFTTADKSLRAYAAQPCPKGCPTKTPTKPDPVYTNFDFQLRWDPGAPAVPAVPAKPAAKGKKAVPAKPAIPARPAAWICVISCKGTVTFDCGEDGCTDVQS